MRILCDEELFLGVKNKVFKLLTEYLKYQTDVIHDFKNCYFEINVCNLIYEHVQFILYLYFSYENLFKSEVNKF